MLYTYLRKEVGFLESDIDVDKFTISIQDDDNGGDINVGFSVPDRPTDEFYKSQGASFQIYEDVSF